MTEQNSMQRIPPNPPEIPTAISVPSYTVESEERETVSVLEYWRVLRKRRWTVLSILLAVVVTATIGTLKQRPVYRAKTVLQIDRENPNILSFKDVLEVDTSEDDYLETAYRILESRKLAYRVILKLNLGQVPEFSAKPSLLQSWLPLLGIKASESKRAPGADDGTQVDPRDEPVIDSFLDRLVISPVRRSRLVEISFDSYDPALAASVVNTLSTSYIDQNLEAKWDATQKASDWLSQQLVTLKAKLEKAEEDLQTYAKDNSILFLDDKQSISSEKLKELQEESTRAESDLIQKQSLYEQVKRGDFSSVPGMLDNKLYQDLSLKEADLQRDYSDLSATFTPEYPKVKRLKSQIDETDSLLQQQRSSFAKRIEQDYRAAADRRQLLNQAVAQQTKEVNDIGEKSIQYNILKREADTNRQLYEGLLERVKEASVSAGMKASNIRVVDPGELPLKPAKPRILLNLALSLVMGLGLGVGMAFFQEHLDNTLKTPADVQRYLRLPALGIIPAIDLSAGGKLPYGYGIQKTIAAPSVARAGNGKATHPEIIGAEGISPQSEAYRSLRTSVLLSASGRPPRVILCTSGEPGEGKTTTAVNLAIALGQLGGRVVIIDSDMRRPRIATILGTPPSTRGLSTYLTGQHTPDEVVFETQVPNLFTIPCGPVPPNPAELLSSPSMKYLLDELQGKFEYIVLDSPPVLHVSDAQILATQVEAVIMVAHGGRTAHDVANQTRLALLRVNANVIGVVLNNVDFSEIGYGYYNRYYKGYGYGYTSGSSHEEAETRGRSIV